ncbi:MAG: hypothetical protein IJI57_03325 [Flexilinea sp.]|nr:hypothetical protein [Flexilinea sp.]
MLAVYAFIEMCWQILSQWKEFRLKQFCRRFGLQLFILFSWFLSFYFEFKGGRSQQVGIRDLHQLWAQFQDTLRNLLNRLQSMNGYFLEAAVVCFAVFLSVVIIRIFYKNIHTHIHILGERELEEHISTSVKMLVGSLIVLVFLCTLCAVSKPWDISRGDVLNSCIFFFFLFMMEQIQFLLRTINPLKLVFPLIIILCFFNTITTGRTWMVRTTGRVNYAIAQQVTSDLVDDFLEADQSGQNNIEIHVPLFNYGDNYPLATYAPGTVSNVLYKYGVTNNRINAVFIPDPGLNEKYGLPVP